MTGPAAQAEPALIHPDPARMQEIAKQARVPVERVQRMYRQEVDAICKGATILSFVGVIADRRVRLRLRGPRVE